MKRLDAEVGCSTSCVTFGLLQKPEYYAVEKFVVKFFAKFFEVFAKFFKVFASFLRFS